MDFPLPPPPSPPPPITANCTDVEVHSVFDLMSSEDRERLKRASGVVRCGGAGGGGGGGVSGDGGSSVAVERANRWDQRPGSSVAAAIASGSESVASFLLQQAASPPVNSPPPFSSSSFSSFSSSSFSSSSSSLPSSYSAAYQPFSDDPQKQERYQAFLRGHRKFFGRDYDQLTEWEKQRELEQFSRAASLYKPLASALSDKFTRATVAEEEEEEKKVRGVSEP